MLSPSEEAWIRPGYNLQGLNQTLHALIYYREHHIPAILPPRHPKIVAQLDYPIILLNSFENLYQVHDDGRDFSNISDDFQLQVNYAFVSKSGNSRLDYFLIDIVDFKKFDTFSTVLKDNDIEAVAAISS